jgi:hypothetical protein
MESNETLSSDSNVGNATEGSLAMPTKGPTRKWLRLTLVLGCALLGTIGLVACLNCFGIFARPIPPEVEAQILVIRNEPDSLAGTGTGPRSSPADDYVATHMVIMRSETIIDLAIKSKELQSLRSIRTEQVLREFIIDNLTTSRANKDFPVISLSFRGMPASDGIDVLNAVIESYKNFVDSAYRKTGDDSLEQLKRERERMETELSRNEREFLDIASKAPFVKKGIKGSPEPSIMESRIQALDAKKITLLIRRAEIQAKLTLLDKATVDDRKQKQLLQQELEENQLVAQELDRLLSEEQDRLKQYRSWEIQRDISADNIQRAKDYHNALVKRANELDFAKEFRGFEVRVIAGPKIKKTK